LKETNKPLLNNLIKEKKFIGLILEKKKLYKSKKFKKEMS
jgi:hypothetical protein